MAINKERVMGELQAATSAEGIRTIMTALVREIGNPRELPNAEKSQWYSIVLEAFYHFNRAFFPQVRVEFQEYGNPTGFGMTSMSLENGDVLYADAYLQKPGDPEPKWHERLAAIRSATNRNEY